ncbi:hypothetical protein [Actinopolymorpha pittospori]
MAVVGGLVGASGLAAMGVVTTMGPDKSAGEVADRQSAGQTAARPAPNDKVKGQSDGDRAGEDSNGGGSDGEGGGYDENGGDDDSYGGDSYDTNGSDDESYGDGGNEDSDHSEDGYGKDGEDGYGRDGDMGKEHGDIKVPCDSDALIAALVHANAEGSAKLELEPKCTYTLTVFDDIEIDMGEVTGLPEILGRVRINGNGAEIVRAANAEPFRIFTVGVGGDLTLSDLKVKGGDARGDLGGGALLVQEGGRATVEESTFTLNRSDSVGGAVSNFGVTEIVGDKSDDHKDDPKKDDSSRGDEKEYGNKKENEDDSSSDGKDGKDGSRDGVSKLTLNSADDGGGALYNAGSLKVEKAKLTHNDTADQGGALVNFAGVAKVTKTEIDGNHALGDGGGVVSINAGTITQIDKSSVTNNNAGGDGGGVWNGAASLYVRDTKIKHNAARDDAGGLQQLGGEAVVDKSEINENKALTGDGGGAANALGDLILRRSEVNRNTAFGAGAVGGGIFHVSGDLRLTDTRVIENASTEPPGGIAALDDVFVDDDSVIIKNRPTNCDDGPIFEEVPNCFG